MASLELGEFGHEGSSDIGIDLAVKKDWPVGFPKLRGELVQVLQRADGRSLKTEALCDSVRPVPAATDECVSP